MHRHRQAHLGAGQADTLVGVHGIQHLLGGDPELRSELLDFLAAAAKGRGYSLLREDRFWAGLLAASAVFMMYYFK